MRSVNQANQAIAVAPTIQPGGTAMADVNSEPGGAEVYIDGVFNSSTPSKLSLPTGTHTISVTRPGFRMSLRIYSFRMSGR